MEAGTKYRLIVIYWLIFGYLVVRTTFAIKELTTFQSCLAETRADLSYPSNETWWYDSKIIYVPVLRHPIAVAYAESTSEVQALVRCAVKHEIKITPRSGGHSYEAFSNEDDHFVIDVSRINFVKVHEKRLKHDSPTATVGAGIRLGRLYYELGKHRMVFPSGRCTTVGLGGLIGAGGFGYLARMYGMSVDNVLELEMVDYRGHRLVVNAKQNLDLFFALRGGGGGSYGIVTMMTLMIYPYPSVTTAFSIHWNQPVEVSDFSRTLFKWEPWNSMPRELSIQIWLRNESLISGMYIGDDGHLGLERIIMNSGLLELGPGGSQNYEYFESENHLLARAWLDNDNTHYGSVWDYQLYNTPTSFIFRPLDLPPYPTPVHPTWAQIQNDSRVNATHENGVVGSTGPIDNLEPLQIDHDYIKYSNQMFVKELDEVAYQAMEEYLSYDGTEIQFKIAGGILYTIPVDYNAFPHRRQFFLMQYFSPYHQTPTSSPSGVDIQRLITNKILTAMEPYTNHMSYQGYPDLFWTTDPKVYMRRYYGNHADQLVRAKRTYDPHDFFSNEQSTPLSL